MNSHQSPDSFQKQSRDWLVLLSGYALAVSICLTFVFFLPHPFKSSGIENLDGYNLIAGDITAGRGITGVFRTPGYPLLLALLTELFGSGLLPVQLVQSLLAGLVPVLLYYPARRLIGRTGAAITVPAVALLSYPLWIFSTVPMTEGLSAVLVAGGVWLFFSHLDRRKLNSILFSALCFGYLSLTRPSYLLLAPALTPALLFSRQRPGRIIHILLIFNVLAFSPLLFWGGYNLARHGRFVLLGSAGGINLLQGACETGKYERGEFYRNPHWQNASRYFPQRVDRLFSERAGKALEIGIKVTAGAGVKELSLFWRPDGEGVYGRVEAEKEDSVNYRAVLKIPSACSRIEYYLTGEIAGPGSGGFSWPLQAPAVPAVYFITDDFLGNCDNSASLLDVFDLAAAVAAAAGRFDPGPGRLAELDADRNRLVDIRDVRLIEAMLQLGPEAGMKKISEQAAMDSSIIRETGGQLRLIFPSQDSLGVKLPYTEKIGNIVPWSRRAQNLIEPYYFFSFAATAEEIGTGSMVAEVSPVVDQVHYDLTLDRALKEYSLEIISETGWIAYCRTMFTRFFTFYVPWGTSVDDWKARRQFPHNDVLYPLTMIVFVLVTSLAVTGMIASEMKLTTLYPYLVLAIYVPLTHLPFHVESRYASPTLPYLILLAVVGALVLGGRIKKGPGSSAEIPGPAQN